MTNTLLGKAPFLSVFNPQVLVAWILNEPVSGVMQGLKRIFLTLTEQHDVVK